MQSETLFLYTTVADEATATGLADLIVADGLAACVQIVGGVRSVYRWKGEMHHDDEWQLVIKTLAERYDALEALLREHHPYELPEIVALPVARGSRAYLDWIATNAAGAAR